MLNIRLINELKKERKYSNQEIADAIELTRPAVDRLLRNGGDCLFSTAVKLAVFLKIPVSSLVDKEKMKLALLPDEHTGIKHTGDSSIIEKLLDQLNRKDKQIEFLQSLIDEKFEKISK